VFRWCADDKPFDCGSPLQVESGWEQWNNKHCHEDPDDDADAWEQAATRV